MSGHSKWANIKHKKGLMDRLKGNIFTKISRMITLSVKEGGKISDPALNIRLRLALDLAKKSNMPKDTIARAVDKGMGEGGGEVHPVRYEAFGPGGAALFIIGSTDNINRTVAEVRGTLERNGGKLGSPGSVSYLFEEVARITTSGQNEMEILKLAEKIAAVNIVESSEGTQIYFPINRISDFYKDEIEASQLLGGPEIVFQPSSRLEIGEKEMKELHLLIGMLLELEDINQVFTNV